MNLHYCLGCLIAFTLSVTLHAEEKTVKAASFGFDPIEATAALQAAIDSGASKVIVENTGKPWIVDKIRLASNQEIVFESGVVVQAKRGAFLGKKDSLFSAVLQENIVLTGPGATLKMWKEDYDDPTKYEHAEWRHVLSFHSCANVKITGLTLADSGGDGVYLGVAKRGVPCSDFVIKDVICDNNYRQGISVISARNLLIEDCVLKNTGGTAPMAGIDFEPNSPTEELVNCVMRNCVTENNQGNGIVFYLRPLTAESKPVSVRIENCRSVGDRGSFRVITNGESDQSGVKGLLEVTDCVFDRGRTGGIEIGDKPADSMKVNFVNCRIVEPAPEKADIAPILISTRATTGVDMGGVHFENVSIEDSLKRAPMAFFDVGGALGLRDVTGTLVVNGVSHDVAKDLMPPTMSKIIPAYPLKGVRFDRVHTGALPEGAGKSTARLRGASEWLVWGEAGQQVTFTLRIRQVGRSVDQSPAVKVLSPGGKVLKLTKIAKEDGVTEYSFDAGESGAHKILCSLKSATATITSVANPVCLFSEKSFFHFLGTQGQFFFWVPAGTQEFGIRVSGDNQGERVKVTLKDPAGKLVEEKDNIASSHDFVVNPADWSGGEVWSVIFARPSEHAIEDFFIRMMGIPPVLSASRESLLKPAQ